MKDRSLPRLKIKYDPRIDRRELFYVPTIREYREYLRDQGYSRLLAEGLITEARVGNFFPYGKPMLEWPKREPDRSVVSNDPIDVDPIVRLKPMSERPKPEPDRPCQLCGGVIPGWLIEAARRAKYRDRAYDYCGDCGHRGRAAIRVVERSRGDDWGRRNMVFTPIESIYVDAYAALVALEREIAKNTTDPDRSPIAIHPRSGRGPKVATARRHHARGRASPRTAGP